MKHTSVAYVIVGLFVVLVSLSVSGTATSSSEDDLWSISAPSRDIRYSETKVFDAQHSLLDQQVEGVFDIGDDRKDDQGRYYELSENIGSTDSRQTESVLALASTPVVEFTDDEMRAYQRALGYSDYEIERMMAPIALTPDVEYPVIDESWLNEIREKSGDDSVDAIVFFKERIPINYIHPFFVGYETDETSRIDAARRRHG